MKLLDGPLTVNVGTIPIRASGLAVCMCTMLIRDRGIPAPIGFNPSTACFMIIHLGLYLTLFCAINPVSKHSASPFCRSVSGG